MNILNECAIDDDIIISYLWDILSVNTLQTVFI